MFDIYRASEDDTSRFLLGRHGDKMLFVIGLNPSTANRDKSDLTIKKVEAIAANHQYDGFVMANLYPLRSTDPKALPHEEDRHLLQENIGYITELAARYESPVLWAAWGCNFTSRPYLIDSLSKLHAEVDSCCNSKWNAMGSLTRDGHPRHPSRLSYASEFSEFDVKKYLHKFGLE